MESDNPPLMGYQAVIYWLLANTIIFIGPYALSHLRRILFPQPYLHFALCFVDIRHILWPPTFLANMGILTIINSLVWPIYLYKNPAPLSFTSKNLNLRAAYRIYANPLFRPEVPAPPNPVSRARFALKRVFWLSAMYLIRHCIHLITIPLYKATSASFSPARLPLSSITPSDYSSGYV